MEQTNLTRYRNKHMEQNGTVQELTNFRPQNQHISTGRPLINVLCSWVNNQAPPTIHLQIVPAAISYQVSQFSNSHANGPRAGSIVQSYLLKDKVRNCKLLAWYISEQLHKSIHIYNFLPDLKEKKDVMISCSTVKKSLNRSLNQEVPLHLQTSALPKQLFSNPMLGGVHKLPVCCECCQKSEPVIALYRINRIEIHHKIY